MRSLLWLLASPLLVFASQITLQSPRVVVLSEDGGAVRSETCVALSSFAFSTLTLRYTPLFYHYRLSLQTKLEPHVTVGPSETLRISFTVLDKDSGKSVVPHQTFLRLYDPATLEEGVHPVKVGAGGKGKIDIVCIPQLFYSIFPLSWTYSSAYVEHEKASRMASPNNGCAHRSPAHHRVLHV